MNKKFFFFFLFFLRNIIKKIECKLFFSEKNIFAGESVRRKTNYTTYFFLKRNRDNNNKKKLQSVYQFNGISLLNSKLKCAKDKILLFFKKNKNLIEQLKDLNEKKSIWFLTGYAKNIFNHSSFYNIIGFEKIKEINYKSVILEKKIDLNKIFRKNTKDEKKKDFSVINGYEVKKYVIFYKNKDDSLEKNFILCSYVYFVFYIFDKVNNKFYISVNNLNNENIIYEVKELNKKEFSDFFYNLNNSIDLKPVNIISLCNKNTFNSSIKDIPSNEHVNGCYVDKFKFFLKRIYALSIKSNIFLKDNISFRNFKSKDTLIYSKKNFFLKKRTYFQCLKNFFIKNEEDNSIFEIIFKDNNGYKLYVHNDLGDNSSYILKSTKISKKKLDKLYKLFKNFNYKNEKCKDQFFTFIKILFSKYKVELEKEEEDRQINKQDYNNKSIYISIGANDYIIDKDASILKKTDEILLFSLAKQFLNNLISCINI